MAGDIEIQIPWLRYDVTLPLIQGRVPIDGVKLVPSRSAPSGTVFGPDSPLRTGNFGLVDLNMASWLPAIEAGWELIGLPIFPKRKHLYTYLFCRADKGIDSAKDLEGKRVFSTITSSAVAVWLKMLLEKRHGVDLGAITWVSSWEQWPIHGDRWKLERLAGKKDVVQILLDGDADAIMVDISDRKAYAALENESRIKRLFPDYLAEARRFLEESGIYVPVHMIAMSRELDRRHPELAITLYAAFQKAKQLSEEDFLDDKGGFGLVDLRERYIAQQQDWGDLFPHGIKANRAALDMQISSAYEFGLIKKIPGYETLFAQSTLNT